MEYPPISPLVPFDRQAVINKRRSQHSQHFAIRSPHRYRKRTPEVPKSQGKRTHAHAFANAYQYSPTQRGAIARRPRPRSSTEDIKADELPSFYFENNVAGANAVEWIKDVSYSAVLKLLSGAWTGGKLAALGIVELSKLVYSQIKFRQSHSDSLRPVKRRKVVDSLDLEPAGTHIPGSLTYSPARERVFLVDPVHDPSSGAYISTSPHPSIVSTRSERIVDSIDLTIDEPEPKQPVQSPVASHNFPLFNHLTPPRGVAAMAPSISQMWTNVGGGSSHKTNESKEPAKSSGGLFTPTGENAHSKKKVPESPSSNGSRGVASTPLFRKMMRARYDKPQNNALDLNVPTKQEDAPMMSTVTYGTSLFLRKARSNGSQISLADRLRNAFKGTYETPATVVPPASSVGIVDQVMRSSVSSPIFQLSYRDPQFHRKLDKRREFDRAQQEAEARRQGPVQLPFESVLSDEKIQRYKDIHKSRQTLQEEISKLRISDTQKGEVPLDTASLKRVEKYWHQIPRRQGGDIIGTAYKIDIQVADIKTLADKTWLNDNVIDFYLNLVVDQASETGRVDCFAFSTHFFSKLESSGYSGVMRWAKRKGIDVTELDYVFVPINRNNAHWCLAVVNNRDGKFQFYDSMNGNGDRALVQLRDYMIAEADRIYPGRHTEHVKKFESYIRERCKCPQQANTYDCGVFTCKNVELLASNRPLNYLQTDMRLLRRRMAHEILEKVL